MNNSIAPNRFDSRRSTVYADRGMVATSQPLAAEAGVLILRNGGNAFDAAVATAGVLNIVEPTSTGLGGDVFALYRTADGEVGAMRSCGPAPSNASIETVTAALEKHDDPSAYYPQSRGYAVDEVDRDTIEMPFLGPHAVTVPGTARGWEATIDRFGNLTLADVLEPAIHYATNGFPVSEVIANQWTAAEDLFTDEHARATYLIDGNSPDPGQRIQLERLGKTMQLIADRGADVVYEGEIAETIAHEVQSQGGFMTVSDLAAFEPEFVDPVSTTYRGVDVFELPPNNQGLIALEGLNIAEAIDAGSIEYESPERIHAFAEATKLAFVDGHQYITDPTFEEIPPLASKSYARDRATLIGPEPIDNPAVGVPGTTAEDADTVLITVGDEEGNLVSYINSRFAGFGSGLVAGETGIALQNRGASFSLNPDHPNRLEPGKRPFHTLIPAVARFDADDWMAFGVMGGYMQPQGHIQVLSNLIDYDMTLQGALDAPRWRYRESGSLGVEERLPTQTELAEKGHDVTVLPASLFGGAQIVRQCEGVLSGATEPRKDGTVVGY